MTYHLDTLSSGRFYLTAQQQGRVVHSCVVEGTVTDKVVRRFARSVRRYKRHNTIKSLILHLFS